MSTDRKSYKQRCPMATALDVVGERWTLLILRELLGGPARFNDLLEGLPGIARNLLTLRLRRLEDDGVLRRITSGGATFYALTELGQGARPALEALGFWGARLPRLAEVEHERSLRASAMALQAILVHARRPLPDTPVVVEVDVDGNAVAVALGPAPAVTVRPSVDPAARVRTTRAVVADFLGGRPVGADDLPLVSGAAEARAALLVALGLS